MIEEKGSQTQTARVTLNRGQPEDNPTLLLSTQRAVTCCVIPGWRVNWAKAIRSTVFRCPILALTNLITPISKRLRFLSFTGWWHRSLISSGTSRRNYRFWNGAAVRGKRHDTHRISVGPAYARDQHRRFSKHEWSWTSGVFCAECRLIYRYVFLSVSGAMSTVIIFSIYSMLGRQVIQTLAE